MPSAETLEFAKLLKPLPGEKPTGADLRADSSPGSLYYAVKDARTAARNAERLQVTGEEDAKAAASPPDWKAVLQNALKALAEKTKDLEITAYLIEAQVRLHGFAGLRDGFRLAREFTEKFWDHLYPLPDEDGLETRLAPLIGLNGEDSQGTLIVPIARVPVTEATALGRLSCMNFQEATALRKMADQKAREKKIAAGAVTLEGFQKAVAESAPKFYHELVQDLTQCITEFDQLTAALDKRCPERPFPASSIRGALESCLDTVKDVARAKLEAPAAKPEAAPAGKETKSAPGAAAATAAAGNGIRTREDAFQKLLEVAEFFRRTEPQSLVPFALEQAVRWGRMPVHELLSELIPEDAPRKNLFKQVGIKLAETAAKEPEKKK